MHIPLEHKYLGREVSEGFESLHKSKAITYVATGLLGIYLPIFLYELLNQNFQLTALFFLCGYLIYALTVAIGARYLNSYGFKKALQTATLAGALFYTLFYFTNESNYKILLPSIILVQVIYRLLYWTPYQTDFAKFSSKNHRGSEVSLMGATNDIISIFSPLLAAFIITHYSFSALFMVAIALYLLSIIPLFKIPHTKEKFSWDLKTTWKKFFSKKRRYEMFAFAADGGEGIIGGVVWPIFMFQVLKGNYLELGLISTFIVCVTIVLQLAIGKCTDNGETSKENILKFGSTFYALGWIFKIFIATAFQIFIIDAYHKLMKIFMRIPFDAITYDKAADSGHYVDEFTVLREMALNLGRVLMLVLIITISFFTNIQTSFIFGAVASILLNTLRVKTF
ncbi:MAG: MFS transporter [Patescibacteria group bacterium]